MLRFFKLKIKFILEQFGYSRLSFLKIRRFFHYGVNSKLSSKYTQLLNPQNILIKDNVHILNGYRLAVYGKSEQAHLIIGDNCYITYNVTILASVKAKIVIGKDVLIASNVLITNENHGIDPQLNVPYINQELIAKDVLIDDGCWIGQNAVILPGVKIGKKCVIGSGAVVTKSIPDYSIAVGNPAKVIKEYNFAKGIWQKVKNQYDEQT